MMPKTKTLSSDRIIAGVGVLVCCALLTLAVPRFIASLYVLYPETVFKTTQGNFSASVYEKSCADLKSALGWYDNSDYWQTQALCYLSLLNASPLQSTTKRQVQLRQAQAAIIQGLSLSPVDPYAWFRLATVDNLLKMPASEIIDALRLSFYAGRVEPSLLMPRLAFSYAYYAEFNEEMRQLWQKQVLLAWRFQPVLLIKFIIQHPEVKTIVDASFAYSPDDLKKITHALESTLKKNLLSPTR